MLRGFAMGARFDLRDRSPAQWVVPRQLVVQIELDSGVFHAVEMATVDSQAAERSSSRFTESAFVDSTINPPAQSN
jgi:hypothetical protein